MAQAVYKYDLEKRDRQVITLPKHSQLLHVGVQGNDWKLWARVSIDSAAGERDAVIRITGTGHRIIDGGEARYLNTFTEMGGALVFHAFEIVDAWY